MKGKGDSKAGRRALVLGASGTIGAAVVRALAEEGHIAIGFMRRSPVNEKVAEEMHGAGAEVRFGDVTDPASLRRNAFSGETIDAVISCLGSRSGASIDADAIDFQANLDALDIAVEDGVTRFILLSAICVQKPKLAFQHAKLRFERRLQVSGLNWTIVRPTAFFKSLSGQVERVRAGKPFLLFGDGELTRCKPISDADLARYLVDCLDDPQRYNRILPIGGPGPALSLREQGAMLFECAGRPPRYRSIPPHLFLLAAAIMRPLAAFSDWAAEKREYLRIAHYYATESMLVWDPEAGRYSADKTPEYGHDTLRDHYSKLLSG